MFALLVLQCQSLTWQPLQRLWGTLELADGAELGTEDLCSTLLSQMRMQQRAQSWECWDIRWVNEALGCADGVAELLLLGVLLGLALGWLLGTELG